MRMGTLRLVTLLLALGCEVAQACVCKQPDNKEETEHLTQQLASGAPYIFLARVTQVMRTSKIPDFDQRANIQVLEQLKGRAHFDTLSISYCQNFALRENEVRVFFVAQDGMILPCSEYLPVIGTEELAQKLRRPQPKQ